MPVRRFVLSWNRWCGWRSSRIVDSQRTEQGHRCVETEDVLGGLSFRENEQTDTRARREMQSAPRRAIEAGIRIRSARWRSPDPESPRKPLVRAQSSVSAAWLCGPLLRRTCDGIPVRRIGDPTGSSPCSRGPAELSWSNDARQMVVRREERLPPLGVLDRVARLDGGAKDPSVVGVLLPSGVSAPRFRSRRGGFGGRRLLIRCRGRRPFPKAMQSCHRLLDACGIGKVRARRCSRVTSGLIPNRLQAGKTDSPGRFNRVSLLTGLHKV